VQEFLTAQPEKQDFYLKKQNIEKSVQKMDFYERQPG